MWLESYDVRKWIYALDNTKNENYLRLARICGCVSELFKNNNEKKEKKNVYGSIIFPIVVTWATLKVSQNSFTKTRDGVAYFSC